MHSPLLNDVFTEPDGNAPQNSPSAPRDRPSMAKHDADPPSVWKPVITRVVLSGLALVGLAGVGAASMLTGLDGARANSPRVAATGTLLDAGSTGIDAKPPGSVAVPAGSASAASSGSSSVARPPGPMCSGRTADGRVILNLATVADLRTLPGIGEKRANAILALRDKLKRFRKIQELRRVRGIGAKTLQRLAPRLLVDPPAEGCPVEAR